MDESRDNYTRKRLRKPSFDEVDLTLIYWFRFVRSTQAKSREILLPKATEFAEIHVGGSEKLVSRLWVDRWKPRHGISLKKWARLLKWMSGQVYIYHV